MNWIPQHELLQKANQYLVGGSLGQFVLPPEAAFVVARGDGSRLWSIGGEEYLDYVLGSGALLIGHAHAAVVEAVARQAAFGSTYYTLNEPGILLAERLVEAVPCAETIQFTTSGSAATFHSLRIARAFTGRSRILKFEGGWHGDHDYAMQSALPAQPSEYPRPIPDSGGIPRSMMESVLVAPFNDLDQTTAILEAHANELAAVIVEPLQRAIVPKPGFLQGLRTLTARHGIVLVFDEIVTGFRLAWGGAQEWYGVIPDLATLGKAISGGYPMAAICGRRDIMAAADPRRRGRPDHAYLTGTFNGNPISAAAGLATLRELERDKTYDRLRDTGAALRNGIEGIGRTRSIPIRAIGDGPVSQVFFTASEVTDWRSCLAADGEKAYQFGLELIKRGVFVAPGGKLYLSTAHTDEDIARTLAIMDEVVRRM